MDQIDVHPGSYSLWTQATGANNELTFSDGLAVGAMKSFESEGIDGFPVSNWQLKIDDVETEIEKMWLVVRYKLLPE